MIPVRAAQHLLLAGCALHAKPVNATSARVMSVVRALGFIQLDSITAVERAHHLIMHARLDGYRPQQLAHHAEIKRSLFEHWTHDASLIRADWLPWWLHRFERSRARYLKNAWMRQRLGPDWKLRMQAVRGALEASGPLTVRQVHDLLPSERPRSTGWWDWSPHKAALEFLWRTGEVAIHSRRNFEKVYDLAARVHGEHPPRPDHEAHVEWACTAALDRLGAATAKEIAAFLNAIGLADAQAWCRNAARAGRIQPVLLERRGRAPRPGFALPDWKARAAAAAAASARAAAAPRLLSPFDPLIRDRTRLLELFGFDYRFEAFVPARKRLYGYYTMPVLVCDRLVCRLDLSSDRERGVLRVDRAWAEPSEPRRQSARHARAAAERLAAQLGLALQWTVRSVGTAGATTRSGSAARSRSAAR
ncbi:MAG: crosslink repair DNA glycosylase YcaQ family protein [Phycisphaerales bacterium]